MDPQNLFNAVDNVSLHFAKDTDLTDDEKWIITAGGIFSSLVGDNLNSIETGRDNGEIREALRRSWLISDRPTFEQVVIRLATSDKRQLYLKRLEVIKKFYATLQNSNAVCNFMSKMSFRFALDWYQTRTKEDLKKINKELEFDRIKINKDKTNSVTDMLAKAGKWTKDLEKIGDYRTVNNLLGWDAVGILNIVRFATQVNYIDREEFVKYARPIKKQVQAAYNSWNEFVLSYVVGSLIWKYTEERAAPIIRVAHMFLTDKKSPVHSVNFK